jgi:hypothetical protein
VEDFVNLQFRKVNGDMPLSQVSCILQHDPLIAVVSGEQQVGWSVAMFSYFECSPTGGVADQKESFLGMVSRMDFLSFASDKNPMWGWSPRWTC